MSKMLLSLAALWLAVAAAPARADLSLSITPSTQTVTLPTSGNLLVEFTIHATADGGHFGDSSSNFSNGFAAGKIDLQVDPWYGDLIGILISGGTVDEKIKLTVTPKSLAGTYTSNVWLKQGDHKVSQDYTLVVQGLPAPEPSTLAISGAGIVAMLAHGLRRRSRAAA